MSMLPKSKAPIKSAPGRYARAANEPPNIIPRLDVIIKSFLLLFCKHDRVTSVCTKTSRAHPDGHTRAVSGRHEPLCELRPGQPPS